MTRQVQLSDEAYRVLSSRKRPGESFSQTVLRLAGQAKDPWAFVGRKAAGLPVDRHLRFVEDMKGRPL